MDGSQVERRKGMGWRRGIFPVKTKEEQPGGTGAKSGRTWDGLKLLGIAALVLLLPLVAYYLGYVWWGRELDLFFMDDQPEWEIAAKERLYEMWQPLREWEASRERARLARRANGVWEMEDGRWVEIRLEADGRGAVHSADFPSLEFEGGWYEEGYGVPSAERERPLEFHGQRGCLVSTWFFTVTEAAELTFSGFIPFDPEPTEPASKIAHLAFSGYVPRDGVPPEGMVFRQLGEWGKKAEAGPDF